MGLNQLANQVGGAPVIRTCQIEETQNILRAQCSTLSGIIQSLEDRLSPVLRPSPPANQSDKSSPQELLVPVASEARDRAAEVIAMTNRVSSILERLELP